MPNWPKIRESACWVAWRHKRICLLQTNTYLDTWVHQ
jgi:hypothetical protein